MGVREFGRGLAPAVCAGILLAIPLPAQQGGLLARRYRDGDSLHYQMEASNQDRDRTQRYAVRADGVVRRDSLGRYVEDFEWSHLVRDDSAIALPRDAAAVRQRLTLAPDFMILPDVKATHEALIAPVLDLLTFYVDLWLAAKLPLAHPGDHVRVPGHGPNSWADGRRTLLGEDAVDFDITLTAVDSAAGVARLEVDHVPTVEPHVTLPAEWMRAPLFETPDNWVQVTHTDNGPYTAGVGRETFAVRLVVRLADGTLVSATMDNPVDVLERSCANAALTDCGESTRYRIVRTIVLQSGPSAAAR